MLPVESPFKVYTGLDGKPLDRGYVYFGVANQNPITSPVTVYWDAAGTQAAAQPLRTENGYIMRAGTPANVFYSGAYSELVQDWRRRQVFYARTSDDFSIVSALLAFIALVASSVGASLIGFIQALAGAVKWTVQDKLREPAPSVLDFMTAAERLAVQTNTWTTITDVSDALDLASDACTSLTVPPGVYRLIRPWILKKAKASLYGAGSGVTEFQPATGFAGSAWGGQARSPLIWHQPPGQWDVNAGWVVGGEISGMTINCGGVCDGIVLNRVNQSQIVRNVHIYLPFNGIDNYLGWCHTYENVYIQGASIKSINLGPGCNGTTMDGCFLRGFSAAVRTQIHLDVDSASVGNSFNGGAIEACDAGVRVTGRGQISINGTDFEENFYRFLQAFGTYSGAVLVEAGGSSVLNGCTFIGVPSGGGVTCSGASVGVENCTFQNNGAIPVGVDEYALDGIQVGQNLTGMPGSCISASNNTFYGWGDQLTGRIKRGEVHTIVLGELAAEDVSVPQKAWTPVLNGFTTTGTVTIQDAVYIKMGRLVTFNFQVQATTIGTTASTSYVTGLPFAPSIGTAASVITGSITNPSAALIFTDSRVYLPTVAAWGNSLIVTGTFYTAS